MDENEDLLAFLQRKAERLEIGINLPEGVLLKLETLEAQKGVLELPDPSKNMYLELRMTGTFVIFPSSGKFSSGETVYVINRDYLKENGYLVSEVKERFRYLDRLNGSYLVSGTRRLFERCAFDVYEVDRTTSLILY